MPVFVSLGRYSEGAIKGMLAKPEDRTAAVTKLIEQAGGKLLAFYMLFGEYDWMLVYEVPSGKEAAAAVLTVAGTGCRHRHEDHTGDDGSRGKGGIRGRPSTRRCLPSPWYGLNAVAAPSLSVIGNGYL